MMLNMDMVFMSQHQMLTATAGMRLLPDFGPGPQNPSWVKVFRYDGAEIYSFISYPDSVKYGVKVSKGNVGN